MTNRDTALPDAKTASETARYDESDSYDQYFRPGGQAPEKPAQQQRQAEPQYNDDADDDAGGNAPSNYEPLDPEGLDFEIPTREDFTWTAADKPNLEMFFATAQENGLDQEQVTGLLKWYQDFAVEHVSKKDQEKANTPKASRSDDARLQEIEKIMKSDFARYLKLGLDKEYGALVAKRGGR
jgi:hypothetical protein